MNDFYLELHYESFSVFTKNKKNRLHCADGFLEA
ncbi:MAG: hypothetical protein ACI92W_001321 [Paraglaciecola sp.]|jgi:hypothetical protein